MADSQSSDPEKSRRTRSFGSFLMVLLVLVVILMFVGNEKLSPPDVLTQDQYEWYLHRGRIVEQKFRGTEQGTNLVEGIYKKDDQGNREFEVRYSELAGKEERFRELKGIISYALIPADLLARGIEAGIFVPVEAYALTANERVEAPGASPRAEPAPSEAPADPSGAATAATKEPAERKLRTKETQKLFATVDYRLPSTPAAEVAMAAFGEKLPARTGPVHFEVLLEDSVDYPGLLQAFAAAGGVVQRRTFDITDGDGGTRWEDNTSILGMLLVYLLPVLLVLIVILFFMRQMRAQGGAGGVMSFGRSRAQLYSKERHTNVTFDDVAGADEAKAEVREIVEFLKNPSRFSRIGGRIPRGVLLVGPPGCGKTLLAKAIAGEAEVPFFSISGSDFVEMFVGVGASRVRDLFKQARENSPCIIFLDEIDAVGRRRGSGLGGGHDEREQTLNAILVEMDGFSTDEGIIVVAATNRPDVLDPALLRPGRFDREVVIDLPDLEGRRAILGVHLRRVKSGSDVDLDVLARSTPGYSGADLSAIINEAAIMAVLDKREEVAAADLEEARDKVRYGRQKKSRKMEEEDRRITAYHEAGHAIVAAILPETDAPHKVTIVPRGRALGATMILPDRESYHMQRRRLLGQLAMVFGGRVAEAVFCGDISAGAADDIRRATDLARAMVTELGMSEAIGPINYAERQGSDFLGTELLRGKLHSERTAHEIDEEVRRILTEAYRRAEEVVGAHREAVERLAEALLAFETISGAEIERLLEGTPVALLRPEAADAGGGALAPRREASGGGRAAENGRPDEIPGQAGLSPA
ncbi:MAG: ATP-dependent zinc metalloprotease FtsH [Planctomycetota bacterium]